MENKTAFLVEPERFEIKETPMPVCGDDDVMIETKHGNLWI